MNQTYTCYGECDRCDADSAEGRDCVCVPKIYSEMLEKIQNSWRDIQTYYGERVFPDLRIDREKGKVQFADMLRELNQGAEACAKDHGHGGVYLAMTGELAAEFELELGACGEFVQIVVDGVKFYHDDCSYCKHRHTPKRKFPQFNCDYCGGN